VVYPPPPLPRPPPPQAVNVALSKPAYVSSIYNGDTTAAYAVDGLLAAAPYGACYKTPGLPWYGLMETNNLPLPAWWYVDLGVLRQLVSITLWGRVAMDFRQNGMSVYAGNSTATSTQAGNTLCATGVSAAETGTNLTCELVARYVFVYKADAQFAPTNDGYLDLCQVQVWGFEF
jgi:ABC-type transport system substrate-binding protein